MDRHAESPSSPADPRALLVVLLGILVAAVPLLLFSSPGNGGPITFIVRFMQGIAVIVGLGVITTGIYSYRSGDLRPAVATATAIIGLVLVGLVGGYIETRGGPLIPIGVWVLSGVLVVGISVAVTYRFVDGTQ